MPRFRDLAGAIIVALLAGGTVFIGTCFGSGLILFEYDPRNPNPEWLAPTVLTGCVLLGLTTAVFVGRGVYRDAGRTAEQTAKQDVGDDQL